MSQPFDASRSLTSLEQDSTIIAVGHGVVLVRRHPGSRRGILLLATLFGMYPFLQTLFADANSTTRSKKSCLTSERRSSSARIRPKDSWCCPSAGSLSGRWHSSTAAADSPRIGRTSIARRWHSCASLQSASCSESFVILFDVPGRTLRS